jgi:hypothetical protein
MAGKLAFACCPLGARVHSFPIGITLREARRSPSSLAPLAHAGSDQDPRFARQFEPSSYMSYALARLAERASGVISHWPKGDPHDLGLVHDNYCR